MLYSTWKSLLATGNEYDYSQLPMELLVKIFKCLPISDIQSISYTCKRCYEASRYIGFTRNRCLHLNNVELDDSKPPIADLLRSSQYYPTIKLTRVKLSCINLFWAEFGSLVEEISFDRCMIWRERIISIFKYMPNLRKVRFTECDLLRDDLFKKWKFFENGMVNVYFNSIQQLSLARNQISEFQFNVMVDMMPNLNDVDLSYCWRDIDQIQKVSLLNCILTFIQRRKYDLECINLLGITVDDIFLRGLVRCRGLELSSLGITYTEKLPLLDPAIIDLFKYQSNLLKLELCQSTGITDNCIEKISRYMPHLEIINLNGCTGVSDPGFIQLHRLRNLKVVDLSCSRISKVGLLNWSKNSNATLLEELNLELLNELDDKSVVLLGTYFCNLTCLNLGGSVTNIGDAVLQHLFHNMPHLVHLNLERSTKLTDAGFTGIDLPQKTLSIWDIEETFSIERLKKLRLLRLSGCYKITDFTLRYALRFKELKELGLSRCHQISKQGIEKLVTSCPALETLDLSECPNINDSCVELVAQNLKRLSTLKLANCTEITEAGLEHISQYCKNLKYLYVRGCHKLPPDITERLANISTLRQVYKS